MSTEAEVLREFLVRLGFQVDKASAGAFDSAISGRTKAVLAFGSTVAAMAATVTYAVTKISEKLDELYFASQRLNAGAENVKAFEYAIAQLGGSSDGARSSLESLARFMRNSPGAEGLLKNLGVGTRDANGELRDTVDLMGELGAKLRAMPYYKANAYAGVLGIDERTLIALRNDTGEFAKEYHDMLARAGVDMKQATRDGMALTRELKGMQAAVGVLAIKFTSLLSARFAQNIRGFRELLIFNMDRIAAIITRVIDVAGTIIDAIVTLFRRGAEVVSEFLDWFGRLNPLFLDIAKAVAILAAGWLAFNAILAAGPIGIVLALGAAILALYDDYKTWKEGGKSLIDWGQWTTEVGYVTAAFDMLRDTVETLFGWLNKLGQWVADSPIGDKVGEWAARIFGVLGNKEARRAVAVSNGEAPPPEAAPTARRAASVVPGAPGSPVTSATASGAPAVGPAAVKGNTAAAMRFFMSSGWTKEQAAGIVANLTKESGLNANAVGDKGSAFGIAQWHPDRQKAFAQMFGHDIKQSSLQEQLQFVQHELTQGAERAAGNALRATKSADLAGEVVSTQYERPADKEGEARKRGELAAQIAQTTNITVQGATDPQGTATAIANAQDDVNNQLVRNTRGAVR